MKINTYPEEYTRGWVEFFYQRFAVNEHVLIPRLETESLVREAVKYCRSNSLDVLIDIGTGSGIIPLSILSVLDIPQVFAVDISSEALEVAKKNCLDHGKNITFLESDLLEVFLGDNNIPPFVSTSPLSPLLEGEGRYSNILLTANLPYIKQDDWENMSADTIHEPRLALFGGKQTGFELYEKLFAQIGDFTEKYRPTKLTILAEMGEDQVDIATEVLAKHGWKFSFFADLR